MLHSFSDVIDLFGGPAKYARAVGMSPGAAKQAKRRKSLNAKWFAPTADAARRLGISEVSETSLAALSRPDAELRP